MIRVLLIALLGATLSAGIPINEGPCVRAGKFPLYTGSAVFYQCMPNTSGGLSVTYLQCPSGQVFSTTSQTCVKSGSDQNDESASQSTSPIVENPTIPTIPTTVADTTSTLVDTTTEKIDTTTEPPTTTTEEPASTTEEPASTVTEPASTTEEPGSTVTEPASTTEEPASTVTEPASTTEEPASTVTEPASTTEEPASTVTEPASTTEEPASTVTEPASTTEEPASTTEEPASTVTEPASTTEDPASTTEEPASTVTEPASTTEDPIITTEEQPSTTEEPASSTEAPETTTEEPPASTGPYTVTEEPTTIAPVFNCPMQGFFPIENRCNQFHMCLYDGNGDLLSYTMECPAGQNFNPIAQFCVEEEFYPTCGSGNFNNSNFVCSREGLHAHQMDCSLFYNCLWDVGNNRYLVFIQRCPIGQIFSLQSNTCIVGTIMSCLGRPFNIYSLIR